ncbi:class I SAM-dependent RNA methyltransferase [Nesterenkonia xinjiangensis]|uniref:tRNA/tmRNA/rRNA uracil-C5-methylase (TrmA/RlmC/RlmD family) n=1 Tax=Nesterenkonia xinjiangensis TaxID=225327 RepID=A0A7Z0GP81_9MICC|nr:TRAM domain-containing protein [Nesterenkonia xinjiangensis]NYJ79635.1 tRNA/tmRNA/rRNA uracil-C5-methylase (TrmA/RlmC/RlmD family) [Nesterenkonia xinjiangensis]
MTGQTARTTNSQQVLTLDVGPMAHGGHCVARHEGRVIFVRHAIPGEVVQARVTDSGPQAKFWRADVIEVLAASDYRRRHIWKLADALRAHEMDRLPVGGAEYGHITDQHQRRVKAQVFRDTLQRIGGIALQDLALAHGPADGEIHVADVGERHSNGLHWRTRVSFGINDHGVLSMKPYRSHQLIDLRGMPLAVEAIHESRLFGGDFTGAERVDVVAPGGRAPLALVVHAQQHRAAEAGLRERLLRIAEIEPTVQTIVLALGRADDARAGDSTSGDPSSAGGRGSRQGARNGARGRARGERLAAPQVPTVVEYEVVLGGRTVEEPLPVPLTTDAGEVRHFVPLRPEGFWQIHRHAPDALVRTVDEMVSLGAGGSVADLYAGAGLFSAWAAERTGAEGRVVSVEAAPGSSASARELFATSSQVSVERAAVERVLDSLCGHDVVLLDPPRAGAGKKVIAGLDVAGPRQIVYVSCEPASFARDAKDLLARGWRLADLQVLDLYPNTHHMESVALFER